MEFHHTRDVPREWQERLEQITPRSEQVNWLCLTWQPGLNIDRWVDGVGQVRIHEPVQRWEIYEMCPVGDHFPLQVLEELRGRPPREQWEFVKRKTERNGIISERVELDSPCVVSQKQWELYHETGCFGQRWWIIQGPDGGHLWRLNEVESNFLKALNKPFDTPYPGDLPYAEFNDRTYQKVGEYDRLRKWREQLDWTERSKQGARKAGIHTAKRRKAEEEEWAERMLKHLESQVENVVDDIPRTLAGMLTEDAPEGNPMFNADEEKLDEDYTRTYTSTKKRW